MKILFVDYEGSGFNVLWSAEPGVWVRATRLAPFNRYEAELYFNRMREQYPNAETDRIVDFCGRIPARWIAEGEITVFL